MNPSKAELRKEFKERRARLSEVELSKASRDIASIVQNFCDQNSNLNHFHLFFPIRKFNEIDTHLLRDFFNKRNKIVYTSFISVVSNEMETVLLEEQSIFIEDRFGIPVPKELKPISSSKIQVVFVPLLVVDQFGNRLGYGKGHYDRFLSTLDPKVIKIGLSMFEPIPSIPKESFDIPLDYCVTPKNLINFSK